jgi:hypothetical protein
MPMRTRFLNEIVMGGKGKNKVNSDIVITIKKE